MPLRFQPARGASVLISASSRGPTGAAATITVGTTTTGAPGTDATVSNSGSSSAAIFNFTIPEGDPGAVSISGTPAADEFAQWTSATEIRGRSAANVRSDLALVIGTNVQAYDADLTTWAGLTPSANAQSLVTAADYSAMRTLLSLVPGTNVQAFDADLSAIAALTSAADKVAYSTGAQTWALADFTSFTRTLTAAANAAAALTTLTARGQGRESIWIPASAMWPRSTNGPASVNRELTTGGDIQIKGWGFDTSTEEAVQFYIGMPKSWNKGTITFQPVWTNVNGLTTETVSWGLSVGAYTDSDAIDSTDLGTEVRVSDTWLAANDLHAAAESAAVTVGNTPIDGDMLIGQIARSVANDNMTGDAELLGIWIYLTTNAATDA